MPARLLAPAPRQPADLRLGPRSAAVLRLAAAGGAAVDGWAADEHVLALRGRTAIAFGWLGGRPSAPPPAADAVRANLRDYFQLSQPLGRYRRWAAADPRMAAGGGGAARDARAPPGPGRCLFSFICSSNNNIARIGMLRALRARYGVPPARAQSAGCRRRRRDERRRRQRQRVSAVAESYYAFPTAAPRGGHGGELRGLGPGYQGRRPRQRAARRTRGASWLRLRAEAHDRRR